MNTRIAAVIVAAGQATRFGAPKVLSPIDGIPAITRVVRTFQSVASLEHIIVVISDALRRQFELALAHCLADTRVAIMIGGKRRQDSVLAGVRAAREAEIVIVHDGARPLVTTELIEASISALLPGADATVTAVPVTDTIKRMAIGGFETVDRDNLWRAQTPQAFRREILLRELERALDDGLEVTDEATLIERAGGRVLLVAGSDRNLKLTVSSDLVLAEALLSSESTPPEPPSRTGIGYDVHRLVAGRDLVIGGVTIPNDHGLEGHSDADVLLHAISDALLGACALGDIGRHFPPTDARYRGISSLILLERVRALLDERGFRVINVDATVIAEAPHLGPHIGAMRTAISHALGLPVTRIGVKATTNEGIGFAGRREGIAAMAVATVWKAG